LSEAALALLSTELDLTVGSGRCPATIADVALPEGSLGGAARESLTAAVGARHVREDRDARIHHAAGRGYPDLVRLRAGRLDRAPDAVVSPGDGVALRAALDACGRHSVAVVPFGGGTSVVGGVEPMKGVHSAVVALDLTRMDRLLELDGDSLTATFEPGIMGPAVERELAGHGLTLGHLPQSFEFSTVGGWVATRSAGQISTSVGRIDDLVQSVRVEAPAGSVRTLDVPASAAGPDLRQLFVGSEGTLGVISAATLRLRRASHRHHYEGWSFRSFEEGTDALRALAQADAAPDVARLSDRAETELSLALAPAVGRSMRLGRACLHGRGHDRGCVAVIGFEGGDEVSRRRGHAGELLRNARGLALGQRPGAAWAQGRFRAPYLRDALLDHGAMVETFETATSWSRLGALHEAVSAALREALEARGTPPLVLCHVSHLYRSGASLYFTCIARQERGAELDQWAASKRAVGDAIVAAGATISHHHGVGRDHMPWMDAEVGGLGIELLQAAKQQLDPHGLMNPGKLIPAGPSMPGR